MNIPEILVANGTGAVLVSFLLLLRVRGESKNSVATLCLQGLGAKKAAAQQFVQQPLRDHPLQFSQAQSFAEIHFLQKT